MIKNDIVFVFAAILISVLAIVLSHVLMYISIIAMVLAGVAWMASLIKAPDDDKVA